MCIPPARRRSRRCRGADLLLMPNGLADAYTAVLEAVQDGTIPQQRLDESVQRILQCKYQYGILTQ